MAKVRYEVTIVVIKPSVSKALPYPYIQPKSSELTVIPFLASSGSDYGQNYYYTLMDGNILWVGTSTSSPGVTLFSFDAVTKQLLQVWSLNGLAVNNSYWCQTRNYLGCIGSQAAGAIGRVLKSDPNTWNNITEAPSVGMYNDIVSDGVQYVYAFTVGGPVTKIVKYDLEAGVKVGEYSFGSALGANWGRMTIIGDYIYMCRFGYLSSVKRTFMYSIKTDMITPHTVVEYQDQDIGGNIITIAGQNCVLAIGSLYSRYCVQRWNYDCTRIDPQPYVLKMLYGFNPRMAEIVNGCLVIFTGYGFWVGRLAGDDTIFKERMLITIQNSAQGFGCYNPLLDSLVMFPQGATAMITLPWRRVCDYLKANFD